MSVEGPRPYRTHGSGRRVDASDFKAIGKNVIIEDGVLVFHPENISLGDNVYIGHNTILKGYHKNEMTIGNNTWIGQTCYFHSAGGIEIGESVGVGPAVKILTSTHKNGPLGRPIIENELEFGKVTIEDGCDIGMGAIILPGIRIKKGVIVGAGAVVTKDVEENTIIVGNPARKLKVRKG